MYRISKRWLLEVRYNVMLLIWFHPKWMRPKLRRLAESPCSGECLCRKDGPKNWSLKLQTQISFVSGFHTEASNSEFWKIKNGTATHFSLAANIYLTSSRAQASLEISLLSLGIFLIKRELFAQVLFLTKIVLYLILSCYLSSDQSLDQSSDNKIRS